MTNQPDEQEHPAHIPAYRGVAVLIALLLLGIAVWLPFTLAGVADDLTHPPSNSVYKFEPPDGVLTPPYIRMTYDLIALNEWEQTVTMRVSGHYICGAVCDGSLRLIFVSALDRGSPVEGLPPAASVTIPAGDTEVTEDVHLPVAGHPLRYPFDEYRLAVGLIMQQLRADGTIQSLSLEDVYGHVVVTLRMRIPRVRMSAPVEIPPSSYSPTGQVLQLVDVEQVAFSRPLYLQVLTVILILLTAAAAAYAVFMRPLDQLVISTGALVVGMWSIRSILLGSAPPGATVVDLALWIVILFLLTAITLRAFRHVEQLGGLYLTRRRPRQPNHVDQPAPQPSAETEAAGRETSG